MEYTTPWFNKYFMEKYIERYSHYRSDLWLQRVAQCLAMDLSDCNPNRINDWEMSILMDYITWC